MSFLWLVETPKWWMNLLSPVARPAFTWNHDKLMTEFGRGLATTTGGTMTSIENVASKPGSPASTRLPADAWTFSPTPRRAVTRIDRIDRL